MILDKSSLRAQARQLRKAAHHSLADTAPDLIAQAFLAAIPCSAGTVVAGYWPLGDEADPRPLMRALAAQGVLLALPVVVAKDAPLIFRRWEWDAPLEPGPYGTAHPFDDCPELRPDLLLVPLLAFDGQGTRLGYGGGYYDRTLSELRGVRTVGVAYAAQQVAELPRDAYDYPLERVVTERGVKEFIR